MLAKQPVHDRLHRLGDRRDDLQAQQIAAERIAHRQRIAARPVAAPEPALEVDAPGVVGATDRGKRLVARQGPPPPPTRPAHTLAAQALRDRAGPPPCLTRVLGPPPRPTP